MDYPGEPWKSRDEADACMAQAEDPAARCVPDFQGDAKQLVIQLGSTAHQKINPGVWRYLGPTLGWPGWLFEGTGIAHARVLPDEITVAQDLMLAANALSNLEHDQVLDLILAHPLSTLGPFAQLIATSAPSLHDAIKVMLLFINSQNPIFNVQVYESGDRLIVEILPRILLRALGPFLILGALIALYQFVMANGREPGQVRIETTLQQGRQRQQRNALQCDVAYNMPADQLVLAQSLAMESNPRWDPGLWAVVQDRSGKLAAASEQSALEERIRDSIRAGVRQAAGVPRLKHLASKTGVSERTLIRAMRRQNTSFHEIVNDERRSAALAMIQDRGVALTKIATALGFSSQSSFGRTFKTWTGVSPGEYRRRLANGFESCAR